MKDSSLMTLPIDFKVLAAKLKGAQLIRLAKLTGVNSSSKTKAAIAQSLQDVVNASRRDSKDRDSPLRITSIDVGIKNLAYCTLEHPDSESASLIRSWQRVDISGEHASNATTAFSNQNLAQHAVDLVDRIVLKHNDSSRPLHILIEQQRWRSGGGPNIFQTTVRVNTFEAMLWAVLATHRGQGAWIGQTHAVNPAQVASLWLDNRHSTGLSTQQKYRDLKLAKIQLLREWAAEGKLVRSACAESDAVFEALKKDSTVLGKRQKRKVFEAPELAKLDDLADSMIQGVTWLQWLKNRTLLVEHGEEGVLELLNNKEEPRDS